VITRKVGSGCGSGSACIDPAFGPKLNSGYYSFSSCQGDSNDAWYIDFSTGTAEPGILITNSKIFARGGRAVRTVR
jgi:hypothetical protein